jgi:hypothetical protein
MAWYDPRTWGKKEEAPKVPSLYSKGAGSLIMRPIISTKLTGGFGKWDFGTK